jgi:RecA/RadA recombinase
MANRLQPPNGSTADPIYSETVEELYYTLDDKLKSGRPFIYVVDSMDGLISKDDRKKFDDQKTAHRKGKDAAGSYGMGRAKANSVNLRMMIPRLEKARSMLIIVFQTRDNVDMFSFEKKTRGGGKAPKFYAHLELWTSIKKKIKKTVLGKPRHVGTIIEIEVKKNRLTGWEGKVDMPFFKRYGIDDVGGCIDYLVEERHWKKGQGGINARELGVKMDRESLARHIQDEGLESRLHKLVKMVWTEIEQKSMPDRRPRYT